MTWFSHFDKSLCGAMRKYLEEVFNAMDSKPFHSKLTQEPYGNEKRYVLYTS